MAELRESLHIAIILKVQLLFVKAHSTIPENEVHSSMTTHPSTTNYTVLTSKETIR